MSIDSDALAKSVARLEGVDPVDTGLDAALELAVSETDQLFEVDGAGLMLLGEDGSLRYVAASDAPGRMLESLQEQFGEGPCVDAFLEDAPVLAEAMAADPRWPSVGPLPAPTAGTSPTSPPSRPTPGWSPRCSGRPCAPISAARRPASSSRPSTTAA